MEQNGGLTEPTVAGQRSDFITLAQPRPGTARRQNEYLETPLRPLGLNAAAAPAKGPRLKGEDDQCRRPPITAQPTGKNPKDPTLVAEAGDQQSPQQQLHNDSIICRQCRRCRCEACRSPKHLPSKWICNNKCLCSADSAVDYCSCVCCVKGLFYHWAKDYETDSGASCADRPCSCSPHARLLRWGCLGLLALPLPCLCCYWPLRGCVSACEGCYSQCSGRGCRCAPPHRTERAPEKRLLDAHSDC